MNCQTNPQQVSQASQAEGNSCGCAPAVASPTVATQIAAPPADARPARHFVPAVDTFEQGDELLLVADVPGAKADAIDIRFNEGELRIHAPIQSRNVGRNFLLQEYEVGHYARAFRIGNMFDPSRIEANFADGVLTLRLPKHEAVKPRKISVKVSS